MIPFKGETRIYSTIHKERKRAMKMNINNMKQTNALENNDNNGEDKGKSRDGDY